MPVIYLVSTLLMGLLLLAVAVAVGRVGQRATPSGQAGGGGGYAEWSKRNDPPSSRVVEFMNTPAVWVAGFVTLSLVFLAGVILVVEGVMIDTGVLQTAVLAVGGAVLVGYVFFGTFFSARDRFGNTATGVAIASVTLGILALIGVVVALIMA